MRLIALGAAVAVAVAVSMLSMAACHDQPPVPPRPTNPTNHSSSVLAETELDASITEDASPSLDAARGAFDAPPPTR
jgi:hypothetical protein